MHSIDKIMDMLDSGNPKAIQAKGIEYGLKIKSINVFLLPMNPGHVKNVWENCARILASKEDELLLPYTPQLFEWLRDLNWPGALIILERLKKMSASVNFIFNVESCIKQAVACDEQIWLDYLSELLDNEPLNEKLSEESLAVLRKHYKNWGES